MISPRLIAITGGSGSGKSWLADCLQREIGTRVARLSLDDFYRDRSHLTSAQQEKINFDHVRAIDWPLLERILRACQLGRAVQVPRYDFKKHARIQRSMAWHPKPLILVDGLWLLYRSPVRNLFDLSIFIDCPTRIRFFRRATRDQKERGRSMTGIRKYFFEKVLPMHDRYVQPQIQWADIVFRRCRDAEALQLARALENSVDKVLPPDEWKEHVRKLAFQGPS